MIEKIKQTITGLFIFSLTVVPNVFALASAPNADPNAPPPPGWVSWTPLVVMLVVFYFFLIRPQSKQRNERQRMLDNLKKGDKIITQGGLHATIVNTGPNIFDIKLNEDTKVTISKSAVSDVVSNKPAEKVELVTNK